MARLPGTAALCTQQDACTASQYTQSSYQVAKLTYCWHHTVALSWCLFCLLMCNRQTVKALEGLNCAICHVDALKQGVFFLLPCESGPLCRHLASSHRQKRQVYVIWPCELGSSCRHLASSHRQTDTSLCIDLCLFVYDCWQSQGEPPEAPAGSQQPCGTAFMSAWKWC